MNRFKMALTGLVILLAAGVGAGAQAPGPGGTAAQGFTVETLISQLSLYLPEEATQGLGGFGPGFGGAGQAGGAPGGGQAGTAPGAASGQAGAQGAQGFRQLFEFTRDAKLYLTKEQIAKLIPILQGLRANPLPTPSKAKQVQASVDSILTVAQKAEYAEFQKQMQKAMEEMRKRFANSSAAGSGATGPTGAPPDGTFNRQGESAGQGTGAGRAGAQMTPTERRQRQLDAFIEVLQQRQKQVST